LSLVGIPVTGELHAASHNKQSNPVRHDLFGIEHHQLRLMRLAESHGGQ
jgi:hypothetical protein